MSTGTKTKTVKAATLLPKDTVVFFDSKYVVQSCYVYPTMVEVIFEKTNDGQPYIYGVQEEIEKVI